MNYFRILIIATRILLGGLFIYAGIQKFIPKPPPAKIESTEVVPDNTLKIREFIGGMKQTGYFWPMLGVGEIVCGILLVSQYFSLLGAVMLLPIMLNIFMFHLFLKPEDTVDLIMTSLYLMGNLLIISYHFPTLKIAFLTNKTITP